MIVECRGSRGHFSSHWSCTSITGYRGDVSRGTALLIGLALGACDSGGLEIVVYGPADPGTPAPSTVKLYIGHGDETAASIAPAPVGTQRFNASRWNRMPDNVEDTAEMVDGVATFVFRTGGDVTSLPVVVAVGFDAQGVPTSSAVMFDLELGNARVKAYSVGLNKVSDPLATHGAGYNGLVLWGPNSKSGRDDACVLAQNTYPDPESRSVFVVTEGDRDCDGVPDDPAPPECLADVWNGSRPPKRDELTCLLAKQVGTLGEPLCVVGGPPCQDGGGGANVCAESRYCAPTELCSPSVCGTGTTGFDCLKDVSMSPSPVNGYPAIECTFFVLADSSGAGGPFTFCPGNAIADLTKLGFPASPVPMCSSVRVRSAMQAFNDKLVDGTADYKLTVDPACQMTVMPEGTYAGGSLPRPVRAGALAIDFQSTLRGIMIPLAIRLEPTTDAGQCAPPVCKPVGTVGTFKNCLPITPP